MVTSAIQVRSPKRPDERVVEYTEESGRPITLIPGDGTGPEVIGAARRVLDAAGAEVQWELVTAGEEARRTGVQTGLPWETIESVARTGLVLKGPLGPGAFGRGSTDRLLRQSFEAFVHVLRIRQLGASNAGRGFDFLVVRNDLADRYPGMEIGEHEAGAADEHRFEERTVRAAFDLARLEGRSYIRCAVLPEDAASEARERMLAKATEDYAGIASDCAHPFLLAQCAALAPELLDVLISPGGPDDLVCELAVRLGGGGSAVPSIRFGPEVAIFEPGHDLLPWADTQRVNDPTGAVLAGVALLRHIGQHSAADRAEHALFAVLRTGASVEPGPGVRRLLSLRRFTDEVVAAIETDRASTPRRRGFRRGSRPRYDSGAARKSAARVLQPERKQV